MIGVGKASFMFNPDESGFCIDPSKLRAIGKKGNAFSRVSGCSERKSTTVFPYIWADGICLLPMIVSKGVAVQAIWTSKNAFPGTVYLTSVNGQMEESHFFNWFCNMFIPHVEKSAQPSCHFNL